MVKIKSVKKILRWTQRILLVGAVSMFGYCAFVLVDAWIFQERAGKELERRLHGGVPAPAPPEGPAAIGPDGLVGRIEIDRIGLSAIVFEGTDRGTLRRAVGHIPGTMLPGQPGNAGLAGHRDTFFRPLKDIVRNDIITVTTPRSKYRYRVVSTQVVRPTDIWVLYPTADEVLTLVTCHPFYFVGAAPNRFIVRAERIKGAGGVRSLRPVWAGVLTSS